MSKDVVANWIRPEIREMSAYHVADAKGLVKLDAMENPFDWPESLKQQWQEKLRTAELNRYPDPSAASLCQKLRQNMAIPDDYELLLGNGSDEIIQMLAMAVAAPGRVVMAPEPSFVMYKIIAGYFGLDYVGVPLTSDFSLDLELTLEQIKQHQPALLFFAQPNNPTGNLFEEDKLRAIIEAAEGLVVIDEAYTAFTDNNSFPLLQDYENVMLMRTLSKVGLAGLRLGLMIARPALVAEINKTRLPYNINVLTQLTAEFALDNYHVFEQQTDELRKQRSVLGEALQKVPGVEVFGSEANFILVRLLQNDAVDVFNKMKQQGVLIKNLSGGHPLLNNCLRLTVGSEKENRLMLQALQATLS